MKVQPQLQWEPSTEGVVGGSHHVGGSKSLKSGQETMGEGTALVAAETPPYCGLSGDHQGQ